MAGNPRLSLETVLRELELEPLPVEGGYFAVSYRSPDTLTCGELAERYSSDRPVGGAIYLVETREQFSAMHRLKTDELYFHHYGDPLEILLLGNEGAGEIRLLGSDLTAGQMPQIVAPAGQWQGSRPLPGGEFGFTLASTAMAPAYMDDDVEFAERDELMAAYPGFGSMIEALTRRAPHNC